MRLFHHCWRRIRRRFDHGVLKALQKATCWAWFDHEVLIALGEELWISSLAVLQRAFGPNSAGNSEFREGVGRAWDGRNGYGMAIFLLGLLS